MKTSISNPFVISGYISPAFFCDSGNRWFGVFVGSVDRWVAENGIFATLRYSVGRYFRELCVESLFNLSRHNICGKSFITDLSKMNKSLSLTLSVLILSTSVSAQHDRKDAIVFKPVQAMTTITVLEDQLNEALFSPNPRSERSGIILCPPGNKMESIPPDIIIDGEIHSNGPGFVLPEKIKSINILRDETLTDRGAGIKGVILIKTKGASKRINKREPLVIINGVVSRTGVMSIDPKTIRSISVLKDQMAIDTFGEAGSNGVVMVTTKYLK